MFTYEVSLVCDVKDCNDMLSSGGCTTTQAALREVIRRALRRGWTNGGNYVRCRRHSELFKSASLKSKARRRSKSRKRKAKATRV